MVIDTRVSRWPLALTASHILILLSTKPGQNDRKNLYRKSQGGPVVVRVVQLLYRCCTAVVWFWCVNPVVSPFVNPFVNPFCESCVSLCGDKLPLDTFEEPAPSFASAEKLAPSCASTENVVVDRLGSNRSQY